MKFNSYTRPFCQDWEGWVLYLVSRNQHRESRNMKKREMCFKQKNNINIQKQILVKWR